MNNSLIEDCIWSTSNSAHGLIRATIQITPGDVQSIVLRVDEAHYDVDLSYLVREGSAIPVNIHTQLLADGQSEFEIILAYPNTTVRTPAKEMHVSNPGRLANLVRESLTEYKTPIAFAGPCDSRLYNFDDQKLIPWFERSDAQHELLRRIECGEVSLSDADKLRSFLRDGFMVVRGILSESLVNEALLAMDTAAANGYQGYRYGESTRLEQLHMNFPAIRDLWLHPEIHRLLGLIFDEESEPCQSLGYVFGSQQDAHQDTIHLTPFPAGYMSGVWIALEDVQADAGALMVYPGSHRLPRVYMRDVECQKVESDWKCFGETVVPRWAKLIEERGIAPVPYLAKRGDVLIWHENLMHSGSIRKDKSLSRRSLVTHNFARGCVVFYDSTGLVGTVHPR